MKKLFCLTYGGGHVNLVESLYNKILNRDIEIEILALTTADKALKEVNIEHNTISEYISNFEYYDEIIYLGDKYGRGVHGSKNDIIDINDTVAYYGIGMHDLIEKHGKRKAEKMFYECDRKAFLPVSTMELLLKNVAPDAVLLTTGVRFSKALGIAANQKNIPVIYINDLPTINSLGFDAKVCVMNNWAREYALSNTDIDATNLIVTGQPVFESNLLIDSDIKQKYINCVKKNYQKCILYLGQPGNLDMQKTIECLYNLAMKNKNLLVLIRPHPNDNDCTIYTKNCIDNFIITKLGSLKYLINTSDVVITHYSTSGLEAALLGKPLITVLIDTPKTLRYKEYKIALEVNDINDLSSAIHSCLYDNEIKNELSKGRDNFRNKENAANNIIDVIENVLL